MTRLTWMLELLDFDDAPPAEMEVHRDFEDPEAAAEYKAALETLGFYVHSAEVPA